MTETRAADGGRGRGTPGLGISDVGLCLDFVNTEGHVRNDPPDRLDTIELFVEWAAARGLAPEEIPGEREATTFLVEARELREALYRIVSARVRGGAPEPDDVDRLNLELTRALSAVRLTSDNDGVRWSLAAGAATPRRLLALVALSAADLLGSPQMSRVKECSSDTCAWVFIDGSRNRSRRWCDMADCGNRAKARRFYDRHVKGVEPD